MFHFTIRDVLWLTVVVGVAVGWWLQFQKAKALDRQLKGVILILNDSGLLEIEKASTGQEQIVVKQGKYLPEFMRPPQIQPRSIGVPGSSATPSTSN